MGYLDYIVLTVYLLGTFLAGLIFTGRNRSAKDMFAAGGRSPWWASGLSGFMTMFSAGTFVVWGGIAYKFGVVAVAINLCYGVSALLVGYFVAGRWKDLGITTPAEFIELRFGRSALHFYTWSMMCFRIVGVGVAMYSLSILLVALMPLSEGNPLRDPATGNLSLTWATVIFGSIVIVYTMLGGLWAVLMTDVLQFIVLNLAVLFVVPLILLSVGGPGGFVAQAPAGFFTPTGGGYTWLFLAGWCAIHFFMVGAEWAFVQRFICVKDARDARRGTYLFGALYLFSPFLWLLPPMIWRVKSPIPDGATPEQVNAMAEQAYILSCRSVLPAGMVGLMLAAMFSATASMVSSQLNVFAGVLTNDIYRPLVGRSADDGSLVWVGRAFTVLLGALLMTVALTVPRLGGAEKVIVGITSLLVVPLLAPTVWGLLSRRVEKNAVFITAVTSFTLGLIGKYGFAEGAALSRIEALSDLAHWVRDNGRSVDVILGVVLPVIILSAMHLSGPAVSLGWERLHRELASRKKTEPDAAAAPPDRLPGLVVAWAILICGLKMGLLAAVDDESRLSLGLFAAMLLAVSTGIFYLVRPRRAEPLNHPERDHRASQTR